MLEKVLITGFNGSLAQRLSFFLENDYELLYLTSNKKSVNGIIANIVLTAIIPSITSKENNKIKYLGYLCKNSLNIAIMLCFINI